MKVKYTLKHTPGPWSVAANGCCVFTDALETGRGVAMCGMNARTPEEIIANTRLIAAAPELLVGLEWAIRQFQGDSGTGETHWEQFPEYRAARAAIIKAKGAA